MNQLWHSALIWGQQEEAAEAAAAPGAKPLWLAAGAAVLLLTLWRRRTLPAWAAAGLGLLGALLLAYGSPSPLQPAADQWASSLWAQFGDVLMRPLTWGLLLGAVGLLLMLPVGGRTQQLQGSVIATISLGFFAASVPAFAELAPQAVFWILAAVTLIAAGATVSMRSPVYSAIWFALSLLGSAGLLFYQGSQFLGVATVVVYAGAIVVTFLFVVMLAQPEGHATYDRLTWGRLPKLSSVVAGSLLVGFLAYAVSGAAATRQKVEQAAAKAIGEIHIVRVDRSTNGFSVTVRETKSQPLPADSAQRLANELGERVAVKRLDPAEDVLHPAHMARLGGRMFTKHLLSVELAGTLLLVALVGAVAIAIQGKDNELEAAPVSPSQVAGGPS